MIIKAHLLVEEMLRNLCINSVAFLQYLLNARLSFSQTAHDASRYEKLLNCLSFFTRKPLRAIADLIVYG